jgi:hypothetical protein
VVSQTLAGHEAVAQLALVFRQASRVRAAEPRLKWQKVQAKHDGARRWMPFNSGASARV